MPGIVLLRTVTAFRLEKFCVDFKIINTISISIVSSDVDLFAIFIVGILLVRCIFLSYFALLLIIFNSLVAARRFLFSSEGCSHVVSIGVFIDFVRYSI